MYQHTANCQKCSQAAFGHCVCVYTDEKITRVRRIAGASVRSSDTRRRRRHSHNELRLPKAFLILGSHKYYASRDTKISLHAGLFQA